MKNTGTLSLQFLAILLFAAISTAGLAASVSLGSTIITAADLETGKNCFTTLAVKSWGEAQKIENDETGDAATPEIAFDSSGNAIVVWQQKYQEAGNNTHYHIWANRFE